MLPVLGPRNDVLTHRLALPRKHVAAAIETVWASALPAVKLVSAAADGQVANYLVPE